MRAKHILLALPLILLAGCYSTPVRHDQHHSPETMLVTYHVRPGKEAELREVISQAWRIYLKNEMVFANTHTVVEGKEDGDKTRIIEVFSWVSHSVPDHAPDSVQKIWGQMQSLCENRDGHLGLELGEVELLVPKS